MNPSANSGTAPAGVLGRLYAPIVNELADVDRILNDELRSDYPAVDELVRYGRLLGGKRLRPALLLLAGKATGAVGEDHSVLAAVVEMIHIATLIHDDVLDQADVRRHLATVNARWDDEASVLLGDFLFTHAFYLASTRESTFACRMIGRATNAVCEGELRQKSCRGDLQLKKSDYLEIIEAKTAALCAVSCQLGAYCSGADETTVNRLSEYGRLLGIAFQIVDDLLDFSGNEADTGKTLGTDLDQRIATLPLILLRERLADTEREDLFHRLSESPEQAAADVRQALEDSGCFAETRETARRYAEQARSQVLDLPPSPSRDVLLEIVDFVVLRSH